MAYTSLCSSVMKNFQFKNCFSDNYHSHKKALPTYLYPTKAFPTNPYSK